MAACHKTGDFVCLRLIGGRLTYPLNLVASLWRSHSVGHLDGGEQVDGGQVET